MKTNLQRRFGIVRDTREVECPFGPGIFFTLRRSGHPAVVAFAEEMAEKAVLVKRFHEAMSRERLRLTMIGKGNEKPNVEAIAKRIFEEDAEPTGMSFQELLTNNVRRIATHIESWRGVEDEEGAPLPFSVEAAMELLQAPEVIGENEPFAEGKLTKDDGTEITYRRTLGGALQAWIESEVESSDAWIEGARGNLQASSAGGSVASAN